MEQIRPATKADLLRIAEIEIFNYRLFFYPLFQNDDFYFGELQVATLAAHYEALLEEFFVYDDGVVKGFIRLEGAEVKKLFVEPVLQERSIGHRLLQYAMDAHGADHLWVLEENTRAMAFYGRHGFFPTGQRKPEPDTDKYLLLLRRTLS